MNLRRADAAWAAIAAALGSALLLGHRRWQAELAQARRRSEQAQDETSATSRMRDHVLASASHDLKTPLASLKLLVHLLRRDADKGALEPRRVRDRLDAMDRNLGTISSLIGELLDQARLQSGQGVELRLAEADLVALAQAVIARLDPEQQPRVKIEAADGELRGEWDGERLERVLQNLIGNALKYSPTGAEVRVTVGRKGNRHGSWAVLTVADQGLGIPAEDMPHIFDWFRRGRNVQHISGTGVGLAAARQIVHMHGGSLEASSKPGRGTTFTLRLPLAPARQREEVRGELPASGPPAAAAPGAGRE
ncbi:MAG: HAMP domain-containing histidine kinase [Chloroflexi bacterium]|nr:HAMP domain-containing histidine kinase [Chloroflexota bacterium]